MWIGVAVVVLMSAEIVADASVFKTEAECRKETAALVARVVASPSAFAYHAECFDATTFLTIKGGEPAKPSAPSKEPPPKRTES